MRKIVAGLFLSLDGVYEAPDQWHFPYFNHEMGDEVDAQMAASDALLLGRVTYQEFAAYWPGISPDEEPIAAYMNDTPKYVASTTLERADWRNTTLLGGDTAAALADLKRQPGKNIAVIGSGALVGFLLQSDLLDELRLLVHPVVAGRGKRLFAEGGALKRLRLAESRTFETGVLSLVYQPDPAAGV